MARNTDDLTTAAQTSEQATYRGFEIRENVFDDDEARVDYLAVKTSEDSDEIEQVWANDVDGGRGVAIQAERETLNDSRVVNWEYLQGTYVDLHDLTEEDLLKHMQDTIDDVLGSR